MSNLHYKVILFLIERKLDFAIQAILQTFFFFSQSNQNIPVQGLDGNMLKVYFRKIDIIKKLSRILYWKMYIEVNSILTFSSPF